MFHVLLCDDERSVTEFLKTSIPWESLGIDEVICAANGKEALEIFGREEIGLLITDIRMPVMDGLELLTRVRKDYPDTHCILLTAYGDFDYARRAFLLGVDNYLLKPIQVDEMVDTIETTVENMYLNRKNQEELFKDNVLRRWLSGAISEDELAERTNLLDGINIYQFSYCAVCMIKTEREVSLTAYTDRCIHALPASLDGLQVWDNSGHHVLILGGETIDRDAVMKILEDTARELSVTGKIRAAAGPVVEQSENLPVSYGQAVKELSLMPPGCSFAMVRDVISADGPQPTAVYEADCSPIVQKALNYIRDHYSEGISIKEFCAHSGVTAAYLGYLFKKETGVFFNRYLNDYRLSKAANLLITTDDKVSEIAEKCGFSSASYFVSSFRKYADMPPQKYREMHS
ncbi:MAG: response regulator [Lachnospiraceae bacterium]|jgi:two-component system response regulator YesN